ncbi:3-hydroxyacyl-CoA dehydrogenase NAD-binding protein [Olsenella uli DSM 7084]|uniref:3-hydroxyacyl-CoA dehydrogenase NAD-binding protein n=1 Tax=Olsenella uli (strain ATCC 49627 / DSM 7084 / CCUG 31166 / CIP 109912 / JCM 12494 / LMG 11480 / NCIMB 702895 / VPI D76D-27C) TaxID=633147 RepID=E1QYE3_OLSUV|nr:3-hydroxyacyl-CoA dehydrogenase [Olsenella uli]ADK67407.1 3-hydroxyacyl-CoA dehydrogenase NAD-binding protein [Olsenella uli DSM 7084]KRO11945.1 3-hydroxyacyl-CoA dehydrogenase NAD-binding protein [Olsenella uli DSM 7084]
MDFKKVTVAGGGVLGSQIAFQSAFRGFDVTVWLRSDASIGRAKPKFERLRTIYLQTLEAAKTNPAAWARGFGPERPDDAGIDALKEQVERAYASLKLTTSYDEAADADLVIESIAEDPAQKIAFYQELAKHLPERTVIATNSSTMLPSAFAEATGRPEKYLALHFANEIWRNNTGEVMGHAGTGQAYYDQVVEFAEAIGMVPLCLHKEQPGYILNSMLVPFLNAAEALWANGVADPETIDKTWQLGTGAPAGPFRILDVVGLTTAYNIVIMDPRSKDPETVQGKIASKLKAKIDAGETGVNAGKGFFDYHK